VEKRMTEDYVESPASKLMSQAIELAIAEESPFPERAAFVNADTPSTEQELELVSKFDTDVVLVFPDGSSQIIELEEMLSARAPEAA
jgi:hypothetical protein